MSITGQETGLALELRIKADAVYDAHVDLGSWELEEQLYEHLDNEFPHAPLTLIRDVIENVMEANGRG